MKALGTALMAVGFLLVAISSVAIRLDVVGMPRWVPDVTMVAGAAIFFGGLRLNPISKRPEKSKESLD